MKGVRFREDGFQGRCEYCNSWWPLEVEFWYPKSGLQRCKACNAEYHRLHEQGRSNIEANRELKLANGRIAYHANKAQRRAKQEEWRKANPEKVIEHRRRYQAKHREKAAAASRAYYAECRDAILIKKRQAYAERRAA